MTLPIDERTEWLETDGLGGFASGTSLGLRTRRYHALLLTATKPPTGRYVLVNGLDVTLVTPERECALSVQRYTPDVTTQMDGVTLEQFTCDPWPRWVFSTADGLRIIHEVFVANGSGKVVMAWRLAKAKEGVRLRIRPLLSGRDYHALHHENPMFSFDAEVGAGSVRWKPYADVPATRATHNGVYRHNPVWYRGFRYEEELRRGFEFVEDLASPGTIEFELGKSGATLVLAAEMDIDEADNVSALKIAAGLRAVEGQRRAAFGSLLVRAGDAYIVRRGEGRTILAGYPWFADWGRDTFIALRGLCLAAGRLDDARDVLLAWASAESRGVMPNRFPDNGGAPEYNSVDASLWFIIAVRELIEAAERSGRPLPVREQAILQDSTQRILQAYTEGTHHGIRMDDDGLLAAGVPGVQLTWMDARVGSHVVTPRIGKPVEIQALWLNALRIGAMWAPRWLDALELGLASFASKFWNESEGCLYDVVDVDGVKGACDPAVRPNQVFAVGGLPMSLLEGERARGVVEIVERRLLTPIGLRSLAPGHHEYRGTYGGGSEQRDGAYHQGTVWPWLMGAFVEAWVRVQGDSAPAKPEARKRFLQPLLDHMNEAGLGHVSEVADGDAPHSPGGCPFQAWSVGELLRLDRIVLAGPQTEPSRPATARTKQNVRTTTREAGGATLAWSTR
jgi:predicted glycogen debranching enzyme